MKKLFLIIWLILPLFCLSQNKISGIGLFKLGDTKKKILDSLVKVTGIQISEIDSEEYFTQISQSKLKGVLRCKNANNIIRCPLVDDYLMHSFNLLDVELNEIGFRFYNDTLYEFVCLVTEDLRKLLNTKYGKAKVEPNDSNLYLWRNDKQIRCVEYKGYNLFDLRGLKYYKKADDCWRNEYLRVNNIPVKTTYPDNFKKVEQEKIIGGLRFGMCKKVAEREIEKFHKESSIPGGYDKQLRFWYPTHIGSFEYFSHNTYGLYDNSNEIYSFGLSSPIYHYDEKFEVSEQIDELTKQIEDKYGKAEIKIPDSILSQLIDIEDTAFDINLKSWEIGKKDIDIYLERRKNWQGGGYNPGYFTGNYSIKLSISLSYKFWKRLNKVDKNKARKKDCIKITTKNVF